MRPAASRRAARAAVSALAAGLAVAVLAGCAGMPGAGRPAGPTATATAQPSGIVRVRFDHERGRERAAVRSVVVPRGATVELVVGSDVARRVLVPELGRTLDVTAGATVTIRFLALGTLSVRVAEAGAVRGGTVIGRVVPRAG